MKIRTAAALASWLPAGLPAGLPARLPAGLVAGLLAMLLLAPSPASAHEWCEPDTLNTYGPSSPVITNVTFNTIDRSSEPSDKELYVHTLESTEVDVGVDYDFSMSYTLDPAFCPEYVIRVWIDWGQDESFDTPGDTVVSVDRHSTGTVSGLITVPETATPGLTRMRVAMKMETFCGHTPIAACPEPEDFGWHGEIEDYNVIVVPDGETDCANGVDDDMDGAIDCEDDDCLTDPACAGAETDCGNGLDDDMDGLVDCEDDDCIADPAADCDLDGEPNGTDCAPADPGAFAPPPEIPALLAWREAASDALLEWASVADEAGSDTTSDVLSGRLGQLRLVDRWALATCLLAGEPGEGALDSRLVDAVPGGYWYLVRAVNACGTGPAGYGTFGDARRVPTDACP